MNIKQLRYFVEICETGSFSKAAERLYISQQGLSMAIKRLEAELYCHLFERTSEGLLLTEDSKYLLPKAIDMLKQSDECELHFINTHKRDQSVKLCATPSAMHKYAGAVMFDFQRENPQLNLKINECSDIMCDSAIEDGKAELAFTLGPIDKRKFDSVLLHSQPIYLLTRNDHPITKNVCVKLNVLKTMRVTAMWDGVKCYSRLVDYCEKEGFTPEIQHIATTPDFARRIVLEGGGVALTLNTASYGIGCDPELTAIPFEDERIVWASYLIKKRGKSLSVGAREFEDYVLKNAKRCGEQMTASVM